MLNSTPPAPLAPPARDQRHRAVAAVLAGVAGDVLPADVLSLLHGAPEEGSAAVGGDRTGCFMLFDSSFKVDCGYCRS